MTEKRKTHSTEEIKTIAVGKADCFGYTITDVLAKGNEYAIYEIDTEDINRKLRVFIDAADDEREQEVINAYLAVKQEYIKAKGLLYRSSNFGMMKNRVAHTLATALSGSPDLAKTEFKSLIEEINDEYQSAFLGRIFYLVPGYLILTLFVFALALNPFLEWLSISPVIKEWVYVATAALVGGNFSLTLNLKNIEFNKEINPLIYAAYGMERISIATLASVICTFGIKSKFIFANLFTDKPEDVWALLFIVSVAAFSEKFVPNIIKNVGEKAQNV